MMRHLLSSMLLVLSLVTVPSCVEEPDSEPDQLDVDVDVDVETSDEAEPYDGPLEVIVVDDPPTGSTARLSDCPSGWFCLWEHANYSGRRLQFRGSGCQNLGAYGFNDKA